MRFKTVACVIVIGVLGTSISCSRKKKPAPVAPPPPEQVSAPAKTPTNCDLRKQAFNEKTADLKQPETRVSVERHFQRVVRYQCDGSVKSDQIETVRSPQVDIKLAAEVRPPKSVFVFSELTCDSYLGTLPRKDNMAGVVFAVTGDGKGRITVKGDLSPSSFRLHLREGLNNVIAEFHHDCHPMAVDGYRKTVVGNATCEHSGDKTRVLFPVHVDYQEKTLSGFTEVRPDPKSCQAADPT